MAPRRQSETENLPEYGTILSEFRQQVELQKHKPAIIFANETMSVTYLQLQSRSRALTQRLKPESNSIVAILLPCGYEYILSVLAVLEASKTYSPLSVDYPPVKLSLMLQELGNPLLVTTKAILKSVGLNYKSIYLLDESDFLSLEPSIEPYQSPVEAVGAAVYFTSGSTGVPKAALVGNKALVHFAKTGAVAFQITSSDESASLLNPGFILNVYDVFMILLSGGTIRIVPDDLRYNIPKLREWLNSIGTVTTMVMVSSTGETFFKAEPEAFPNSFKRLVVAGEKLQSGPPPDAPFKVYSAYGSTESMGITVAEVASVSPFPNQVTHTLAGIPFPGVSVYILDEETLQPLPAEGIGEIVVAGPCLFHAYLNHSEETEKKFLTLENGIRVCRIGDLGYIQRDGNLVLLNRRDNQIKVAGYRFDLSDLEAALLQHSSVEKAVAVLEKLDTLKFHLFYQLKPQEIGKSEKELKIHEFLQDRLPHYAFPHSITKVDEFPRNGHGKIDKKALLPIKTADLERKVVVPPATSTEKTLALIWSELLKIPGNYISRTDNFFSLGGSSVTAAAVIMKLKDINTDFQVEPLNIFRRPVLMVLAEFLDKSQDDALEDDRDFEAEVNSFSFDFMNLENLEKCLEAKHILITGSTGYLGGALLMKLLESTDSDIYCLIRANSQEEAGMRLETSYSKLKITLESKYHSRLHFVPGNLSKPSFGLPEAEYNSLTEVVDQVYHCAAEVHWLKRYDELRASNVLGTLEILKFVTTNKLKFLNYISTIGVLGMFGGDCNSNMQLESRAIAPNIQYEMGYTQSKWIAEKLIWRAIDAGVPAIVYRPGSIGSDSKLGIVNPNDFVTLLFQVCKSVGAYPDLPWEFPYSTVNFTVNSIFEISKDTENNCSKSFHTFQNGLSFEDFYDYFDQIGLKKMALEEWEELILNTDNNSFGALGMTKLFLSVPYYKNLTFFQLPFSDLEMSVSNAETMKIMSSKFKLFSKAEQTMNFVEAVLNNN